MPYNKSPQLLRASAAALSQRAHNANRTIQRERLTETLTDRLPQAGLWKYKSAPPAQGGDLRRYRGKIDVE